jgi:hypothetical protein
MQLDRAARVRGRVLYTLGAQNPFPHGLTPRRKIREHPQKRYGTGWRCLKQKGPSSLCSPPTPPHGQICQRQRLVRIRVDVEGRHDREGVYRPHPRTRDRTTAVLTSDPRKYLELRRSITQGPRTSTSM